MMKSIYVVRHCEAKGQGAHASLSNKGLKQAQILANFLSNYNTHRILSSPYLRAIQSIEPFSKQKNIEIEVEDRLKERILSSRNLPDWLDKLEKTYEDWTLTYEGGESSLKAMKRIVQVVEENLGNEHDNILLVTHGNIMSLLLHYFDNTFGFNEWKNLSNPDIFQISLGREGKIKRLWKTGN